MFCFFIFLNLVYTHTHTPYVSVSATASMRKLKNTTFRRGWVHRTKFGLSGLSGLDNNSLKIRNSQLFLKTGKSSKHCLETLIWNVPCSGRLERGASVCSSCHHVLLSLFEVVHHCCFPYAQVQWCSRRHTADYEQPLPEMED